MCSSAEYGQLQGQMAEQRLGLQPRVVLQIRDASYQIVVCINWVNGPESALNCCVRLDEADDEWVRLGEVSRLESETRQSAMAGGLLGVV